MIPLLEKILTLTKQLKLHVEAPFIFSGSATNNAIDMLLLSPGTISISPSVSLGPTPGTSQIAPVNGLFLTKRLDGSRCKRPCTRDMAAFSERSRDNVVSPEEMGKTPRWRVPLDILQHT